MATKLANQITFPRDAFLTDDKVIRSALKEKLKNEYRGDLNTKVVEELGVTHGAARIDIAVVNGIMHGYELKSDKDTLDRLPDQIKIYNTVFDRLTLVVGKSHLHDAIGIVPEWWGITIAKFGTSNNHVSFFNIREPEQNPNQDSMAIAALLWKQEALNVLEKIGQAKGVRSKSKKYIYQRLGEVFDKKKLGLIIRDHLRARANWPSDLRCMLNDD